MKKYKPRRYTIKKTRSRKLIIDNWAGYLTVFVITLYVLAFGYYQSDWFILSGFSFTYLIIIIPLWTVDGFKVFLESFAKRSYKTSEEDLSKITVVIACKDGEEVISATLISLLEKFKPQQIILASNGSTDDTCHIARGYGVITLDIKSPLGKIRAINYALRHVNTPYVLLLDDDTLVGDAVMPTGLLEEGYEGVAFRVLVKVSNWITKIQMYEYHKSTDLGKRYHNNRASVQNISGAIGLFELKQLKTQIKRHSGEFSGEDLQRTLLIHLAQNSKGVVLSDSTVYTQAPTTLLALYRQRSFGWFPGLYANFYNYCKIMTRDKMPFALRFDAFYNIFLVMVLDILRVLSLPILIFYPWYFVIMYITYLILETISFLKSKSKEPFWVVLVYPLYGLFGFFTRSSAFATFTYRRLTVKFARREFLDDYRSVSATFKIIALIVTITAIGSILILNVLYYYAKPILSFGS